MTDYKMEAAKAAVKFIKPGQAIGLGAGTCVANLLALLAADSNYANSLTFASSSFKTASLIADHGLNFVANTQLKTLDIYFDGCDQFDADLNALKSGGGIHTSEKIMASIAKEFIIIGDSAKFATSLDTTYPLVIEVLPNALQLVQQWLIKNIPQAKATIRMAVKKDGAVITENGNLLLDVYFTQLIDLEEMNRIKMVAGVVEHSLFYKLASKAIIAGEEGISILSPQSRS